jgi:hypothetical protein
MKLEISGQIFEKYSNIKFRENLSVGTELFLADGQTDRHDEANSRLLQFCESGHTKKVSCISLYNCVNTLRNASPFCILCLYVHSAELVTEQNCGGHGIVSKMRTVGRDRGGGKLSAGTPYC